MLGKNDLVDNLSRDLDRAREKRDAVCTENPIRIDGAMESPKLVE